VIFFLIAWNKTHQDRYFYLACVSYAFSFGNHLTMIGLLPAFAYCVWVTDRTVFTNVKKILLMIVIIIAAFSQYYYVVWRTNDPTTRFLETNTQSLINFLTYFHQDEAFTFTIRDLVFERVPILAGYILREFSVFIILVFWGMISFRNHTINKFLGLCLLGEILFCLNINGRETWAFFIPVYIILAIYLGMGIEELFIRYVRYPGIAYLCLFFPIFFLVLNFQRLDQSDRVLHARMVEKALSTASHDAVIIVDEYDSACFFWYYLIGEDYEKNNVYALPYYFLGIDGINDYLLCKRPIRIAPERKSIQPGLQVYAYWTIADQLRRSGFKLRNTSNKYIFLLENPD